MYFLQSYHVFKLYIIIPHYFWQHHILKIFPGVLTPDKVPLMTRSPRLWPLSAPPHERAGPPARSRAGQSRQLPAQLRGQLLQYRKGAGCLEHTLTFNTFVRSSQRPCMSSYGGAPTAAGWCEDCWTGPPTSSPPGAIRVTAPTLGRVYSHAQESRSATGTE